MTPARHARASELFLAAVELAPAERDAFLFGACGDDLELRREVQSLLALDAGPAEIDEPVAPSRVREAARCTQSSVPMIPARIGSYEILGLLGRGGMGTVYRARQTRPERLVALKVMSDSAFSPSMIRRFEFESQVLALLQHPGIAQIFESGIALDGHRRVPYFAMELVEGLPLTDYAERYSLSLADRLDLLLKVCAAVQHAHQKGVIHRDLKPENILVMDDDAWTKSPTDAGEGLNTNSTRGAERADTRRSHRSRPKILDFGIARTLDPDLRAATLATAAGQIVGTLPYMSPEQVAGNPAAVDTRSDIYSLGVTAFELLTGRPPHDLRDKPLPEAVRVIQDAPPSRLSSLDRTLRGDLDTIVAKALEKEKDRRYASVSDFAADIERFLRDEPISARPPSRMYQLWKFTRRNRLIVGAVASAFGLLVAAFVGTSYGIVQARREKALAERRLVEREAVSQFMLRILTTPRPDTERRDITVVEALEVAQKEVSTAFADKPEIRAAVHLELGGTYFHLGRNDDALHHLRIAHDLFRTHLGDSATQTLKAANDLGVALTHEGSSESLRTARVLLEDALADARRQFGRNSRETAELLNQLAGVFWSEGNHERAESLTREALQVCIMQGSQDGETALSSRINLAVLCGIKGDFQSQESEFRQTLELLERTRGGEHPETLKIRRQLANTLMALSGCSEAERILRSNAGLMVRVLGERHFQTLQNSHDLSRCLFRLGRLEESVELLAETVRIEREALGSTNRLTRSSLSVLADMMVIQHRMADAEPIFRELAAIETQTRGFDVAETRLNNAWLAICAVEQDRLDESRLILESLRRDAETAGPRLLRILTVANAAHLWKRGEFESAESDLLGVEAELRAEEFDPLNHVARRFLAQLYEAWNQPDRAAGWKAKPVIGNDR